MLWALTLTLFNNSLYLFPLPFLPVTVFLKRIQKFEKGGRTHHFCTPSDEEKSLKIAIIPFNPHCAWGRWQFSTLKPGGILEWEAWHQKKGEWVWMSFLRKKKKIFIIESFLYYLDDHDYLTVKTNQINCKFWHHMYNVFLFGYLKISKPWKYWLYKTLSKYLVYCDSLLLQKKQQVLIFPFYVEKKYNTPNSY